MLETVSEDYLVKTMVNRLLPLVLLIGTSTMLALLPGNLSEPFVGQSMEQDVPQDMMARWRPGTGAPRGSGRRGVL